MFCKSVWNGVHILPDGYIRLCSIGANYKPELDLQRCRDKDGNVMNILTHSINDILNSDKHTEVRQLNIESPTKFSPHCDCCENREIITNFDRNHPNKSRRVYLMNIESNDVVNEHNYSQFSSTVQWMPSSLDIRFGNLCNQKCVMCSPIFSNQWYDEYVDFFKTNEFGQGKKIKLVKNQKTNKWDDPEDLRWFENPIWWTKFEEMMPFLKHLYITGGEPMIVPAHDEMLDRLISSGFSKNIWLEYDSNCSAINDKIIKRWKNFKRVDIRGSMDAVEDQYEIIRFGGKWKKFKENVERLKSYEKESNRQIRLLSLSTCFQIPTIFSIVNCDKFCKSIGVDFHLRFLETPRYLSTSVLPQTAKEELLTYFKNEKNENSKTGLIIKHLEKSIKENNSNKDMINRFFNFMNYLDTTRQTNWKETFSELNLFLSKHVS